jgi:hypothetical protein
VGRTFAATINEDVAVKGTVLLRAGTKAFGKIQTSRANPLKSEPLSLELTWISVNGRNVAVKTDAVQPAFPVTTGRQARYGHTAGTLPLSPGTKFKFRLAQEVTLALIPCWRHTTFVRSGRSGRPRETKGVTVTVPLLTGREIRALKRPEASSVKYCARPLSAGTGIVANSIQNLPAFVDPGQHSIVTAPADTDPSPRMRNLTLRGSGSTSPLPVPVVALSCRGFSTLIIAFPL